MVHAPGEEKFSHSSSLSDLWDCDGVSGGYKQSWILIFMRRGMKRAQDWATVVAVGSVDTEQTCLPTGSLILILGLCVCSSGCQGARCLCVCTWVGVGEEQGEKGSFLSSREAHTCEDSLKSVLKNLASLNAYTLG